MRGEDWYLLEHGEDQSKHHRRNCNNGLEHGVITIIVLGFLLKAFDRCANELM